MASAGPKYSAYIEENLECAVCLQTVVEPYTLLRCLHNYCRKCVDELIAKQDNPAPGVCCPVCRNFCPKDEIQANFFINNRTHMHRSVQSEEVAMCEQCSDGPNKSEWKCLDCRMTLCQQCRNSHLKIKILQGHRIVALSDADRHLVVDQLVFCSLHKDKPIELYCTPCKLPICFKCKATKHDGHPTETVEEALEAIIPEMEQNTTLIDEQLNTLSKSEQNVNQKITEAQAAFEDCRKQVKATAVERIQEIKTGEQQLIQQLDRKEQQEVAKLVEVKEKLQKRQVQANTVKRVMRTTLDQARHATLLTELTQGGLQQKIDSLKDEKEASVSLEVSHPRIEVDGGETWEKLQREGLLGKLVYHVVSCMLVMGGAVTAKGNSMARYWDVDGEVAFGRNYKKGKEIVIGNWCGRMMKIETMIWAPSNEGYINIYNTDGKLEKKMVMKGAMSVNKAHNGDVFVACNKGCGLYVIVDGSEPRKVCTGSYSDVACHGDKVYALDYEEKSVLTFVCDEQNRWKQIAKLTTEERYEESCCEDTLHVIQSHAGLQFYITQFQIAVINMYNELGHFVKQYTVGDQRLCIPHICGSDERNNLLVADTKNKQISILNTESGVWSGTVFRCEDEVCDAYLDTDGSVWVLYYFSNKLVKYEYVPT